MKRLAWPMLVTLCLVFSFGDQCPKLTDIGLVDLPETFQETNMWCWAASMEAVLDVYDVDVQQCVEANWLFSRNDCCNSPTPGACVAGASGTDQKNVLDHWGLDSTLVWSSRSWAQLKSELKAPRPMNMGWSWCGGGGHSLDIYGFSEFDDGTQNVAYMDPWPGEGYNSADYDWVVGGCGPGDPGDHSWYRTLYDIKEK